jgi:hypothetical protein
MELLTVDRDRIARYMTANPWPVQPPFDEIGWYHASLQNGDWEELRLLVAELPDQSVGGGAHSSDIRSESLEVDLGPKPRGWEWLAPAPPEELAPVVETLRRLIRRVRDHPVRALRASIEAPYGRLLLENRGEAPFHFYGFGGEAKGARAEIRVRPRERAGPEVGPGLPVGLATDDPLLVSNIEGMDPSPDGMLELPPKASVSLSLPRTGGELLCLLRVCFPTTSLSGEPFVQEGWILAGSEPSR